MSADALSQIYYVLNDPGSMSGVEQLLRRARQLHIPGATQKNGPGILTEQAGLCATQASAPLVYQKSHLRSGDRCTVVADMQGISRQYGGIRLLLPVFDVFSYVA